jgi:hypothetical protein
MRRANAATMLRPGWRETEASLTSRMKGCARSTSFSSWGRSNLHRTSVGTATGNCRPFGAPAPRVENAQVAQASTLEADNDVHHFLTGTPVI